MVWYFSHLFRIYFLKHSKVSSKCYDASFIEFQMIYLFHRLACINRPLFNCQSYERIHFNHFVWHSKRRASYHSNHSRFTTCTHLIYRYDVKYPTFLLKPRLTITLWFLCGCIYNLQKTFGTTDDNRTS